MHTADCTLHCTTTRLCTWDRAGNGDNLGDFPPANCENGNGLAYFKVLSRLRHIYINTATARSPVHYDNVENCFAGSVINLLFYVIPTLRVMVLACNIYHVGIWYARYITVIYFNGLSNTKGGYCQFLSMF